MYHLHIIHIFSIRRLLYVCECVSCCFNLLLQLPDSPVKRNYGYLLDFSLVTQSDRVQRRQWMTILILYGQELFFFIWKSVRFTFRLEITDIEIGFVDRQDSLLPRWALLYSLSLSLSFCFMHSDIICKCIAIKLFVVVFVLCLCACVVVAVKVLK